MFFEEMPVLDTVVVFVKDPQPGTVKTRLTPFLSPEEAADLYQAFIRDTLHTVCCVPDALTSAAFTPDDARVSLQSLGDNQEIDWFSQTGDTLGARLWHAFQRAFQHGASRVVTIGSDSPALPASIITQAFEALTRGDVVLGPATDGGYYLIGLAHRGAETDRYQVLFEDIAWSTEMVYTQTVDAIRQAHLTYRQLPVWFDIDQPEDLLRLIEQIRWFRDRGDAHLAVHTERMLKTLHARLDMVMK